MERQMIYEHLLNRGCASKCDAQLARLIEEQGVSVPDDDANLRLRQNLFNLTNLGDKVEADGAAVLEQAVFWLDGLLKEASLEKDGPLLNLRLEIRTQCVLTHLSPPNVLGKAAARNAKKALEKQFPKRDSGGSKGPEARETLRYKLLDKARASAAAPAAAPSAAPTGPPAPPLACQAIQECHEKNEADLKKTLDLHSFERMLKALNSQLPRVKEALELPEPRLDQVLG